MCRLAGCGAAWTVVAQTRTSWGMALFDDASDDNGCAEYVAFWLQHILPPELSDLASLVNFSLEA